MRTPLLFLLATSLPSFGALAQDLEFHGSLAERLEATLVRGGALVSTRDMPRLRSVSEANLQARARLLDDRLTLYSDVSAFYLVGGGFVDTDLDSGMLTPVEPHDVVSLRPRVVFSEAYLDVEPLAHLRVTVGKKRVVFGSGQHVSPTDVLNPARDPTDTAFQREGSVVAIVDLPFESFTLTGLVSPAVLYEESGIPYAVYDYPRYAPALSVMAPDAFADPRDDEDHFAAALRLYALLFDTDVNLWLVYSNLYRDAFEDKLRLMASASRTIFDYHEVHFELLAQTGSARLYPNGDCVTDQAALARCAMSQRSPLAATRLDDEDVLPRLLLGSRSFLPDESILSVEYLYQADGYTRAELADFVRLQSLVGELQRKGLVSASAPSTADGGALPSRFQFDPVRRHYLFLSYQKPRVFDDWTLAGTLITAVEDLSSIASFHASWMAQEWLTLSLFGFFPLPSVSRVSSWIDGDPLDAVAEAGDAETRDWLPLAPRIGGEPYGEYDAVPFDLRLMGELRIYF